jgi:uncharacterized protein (DUF697 family)
LAKPADGDADVADAAQSDLLSGKAPVVWLLGKVQSGKTSIIRTLTGCTNLEIGRGFKATTKTSEIFDFPDAVPLIRFLDTRGLGEVDYDPAADMAFCEQRAHLLLVVMKAADAQQDSVVSAVRLIRKRKPDWPIVVAQTTLHHAYAPDTSHPLPYPFEGMNEVAMSKAGVPEQLRRNLAYQRKLFEGLPGKSAPLFVPLDFTQKEDGYPPIDYGLSALVAALETVAPLSVAASLKETIAAANETLSAAAHPRILAYSLAAAASDVVPIAGAIAVPGVQAQMLRDLAGIYGVSWDRYHVGAFAAGLGTGMIARTLATFGIRELVKLVPVYGQTAGTAAASATSFATTFALGKAACRFMGDNRLGRSDAAGLQGIYRDALRQAFQLAKERALDKSTRNTNS